MILTFQETELLRQAFLTRTAAIRDGDSIRYHLQNKPHLDNFLSTFERGETPYELGKIPQFTLQLLLPEDQNSKVEMLTQFANVVDRIMYQSIKTPEQLAKALNTAASSYDLLPENFFTITSFG